MRTRLLLVLFLLSAAAVAGFAWPLLESTAASRTQELLISRTAELDRFAALAQQADDTGDTQQLALEIQAYSDLYGESVLVVDTRKRQVVATGGLRAQDVLPLIDSALRNQPGPKPSELRPWSSENLLLARPVGAGTRVAGAVVLKASVASAASDVAHDWLLIVVGAMVAALVFALLALVVSRWVLRPLAQLEHGVLALAAGEERTHVPASAGPRELRALGASFNKMSDAVAEASEQQRRLVADASHQLRNPMAALRLRVDSLAGQVKPDGLRTYNGCVAEVERMESLLDGLLALATADNADYRETVEDTCDAATVLVERHDAWHAAADRSGVALHLAGVEHFIVAMPDSELGQVLDVLLDNAVKYAGSGARVDLACADGTITVSDNGPGLPPEDIALATQRFWRSSQAGTGGTGLGLAIAERLVSSRDGQMTVEAAQPHGLAVRITLPLESA
ncbi:two-component sensor histidine kinase [Actinosynnema sp. ALI-1.44]|uniref:sensor histidine kinase n=1 Tax=Actinosynnema sp. ALI-1.44 TaxID=1933779 RepID=UPI00097C84BF|nr:HAMP domain-containing sensor histidine kinase [Actinosynnema sp. ALI-1.44]ONI84218.1 two-component sensor histidine kinase [Actinosynnema sp. ALI-1.44]